MRERVFLSLAIRVAIGALPNSTYSSIAKTMSTSMCKDGTNPDNRQQQIVAWLAIP